ncbi:MAG: LptA/OstA family protein [Terrimicrobiaceae bacterium]
MKIIILISTLLICLPLLASAQESQGAISTLESDSKKKTGFIAPMGERPKGAKTEITASEEATFDNEKNVAEFKGRVVVKDPQFTLTCDKLTVQLGKDRGGIELAEATGSVIVVQELQNPKPGQQKAIGRAGKMSYKPDTGDVTLREWPSIQQGINNQVATEAGTVMYLKSSGESRTVGGSKTVITDTATVQ